MLSAFGNIDDLFLSEYARIMKVKVVLERGDDGYFVAHCPALQSCWSQGKTREEVLQNIRDAVELYLEPDPTRLPEDSKHEVVELS